MQLIQKVNPVREFSNGVNQTIKKYKMLEFGDKVLIAVSGGADSLSLLFSLNALKENLGLRLYIAHLDHMLRKNSYQDLLFVKAIAKKLEIPFYSERVNIKQLAKNKNLEEAAREKRIEFLVKTAKKIQADKIALGHTLNDQAETVLMRIIKGSGLYGLSSILPKRNINGFSFIRPLIEIRHMEAVSFLKEIKIKPRIDSTNFETKFLRNKIRHQLLPLLEKEFNPRIAEVLSRLAETSSLDYELLEDLSSTALKKCKCKILGKSLVLGLKQFSSLDKSIQRIALRLAIARLTGSLRRLNFKHWQEFEGLILNQTSSSSINFPRQICIAKQKDKLVISVKN